MIKKHIKKVALMENYGADFYNYRIPLAKFLIEHDYEIIAIVPEDEFTTKIKESGIIVESYSFERNSLNPFKFLKSIYQIKKILKRNRIDLIHTFRLQPNLYGTVATLFCKTKYVINHITGLGVIFSINSLKYKILQFVILLFYKIVFLKSKKVIFQNPDDIKVFKRLLSSEKICLIKGSGINHNEFSPQNVNSIKTAALKSELNIDTNTLVFTLISRLIWQKGIKELVSAAKILNRKYSNLQFLIVGTSDLSNPFSVDNDYVVKNDREVKFLGKRKDIKEILAITSVFVLPSYYREGIPRSILEAMAMEKPIISTNTPGCNLTIDNYKNGIIIEPRNVDELVNAIEYFIDNEKNNDFGLCSRRKLIKEFSEEKVLDEILKLYKNL